jgi:hypothetical protein
VAEALLYSPSAGLDPSIITLVAEASRRVSHVQLAATDSATPLLPGGGSAALKQAGVLLGSATCVWACAAAAAARQPHTQASTSRLGLFSMLLLGWEGTCCFLQPGASGRARALYWGPETCQGSPIRLGKRYEAAGTLCCD